MIPWHRTVLLNEVITWLSPRPGGVYLDATLGDGGHAEALLRASAPDGRVVGLDWDDAALERAGGRLAEYGDRVTAIRTSYAGVGKALDGVGVRRVDGAVFDLGLSTIQIETPDRGFSFQADAPLDMRMDRRRGATAADLLTALAEPELADLLRQGGEARFAKRIARAIARERARRPIATTRELADLVARAAPGRPRRGLHPATLTFQTLRLAVNAELAQIEPGIRSAAARLAPGGRVAVIAFHSGEDRIVKRLFREMAGKTAGGSGEPPLQLLTKKPIRPSVAEVRSNPRARSARLRVLERTK